MIVGEEFYEKNKILLSSEFNDNFANVSEEKKEALQGKRRIKIKRD